MIPQPAPSLSRSGTLAAAPAAGLAAPVPGWLRRAVEAAQGGRADGDGGPPALEEVALAAGAALAVLDALVRAREKWAGAWRQRLALAAAAATARAVGRVEDEAALRDAVLLARPGDGPAAWPVDVGPGGLLFLAWRRLAMRPAADLLTAQNIAAALEEFGYAGDGEAAADLASDLRRLGADAGTTGLSVGAFASARRHGFGRAVAAWSADALLAQKLGWTHAVPLLGTEVALAGGAALAGRRRPAAGLSAAGAETEAGRAKSLLAAQARAALRAIDLFVELGRRADRLVAVAPKLRARGADAIVARLLNEDALVASRADRATDMSDRGLRRLFDRLVELGAVRELTGRPAFRIYGL